MNINVQMNPCFKEVDRSRKRYIVMKGSAGSGKSVDTAQNYILRLMKDKGRNLVCIRKSDITNRDSTFAELTGAVYRMFGDKADRYWQVNMSPLKLTCRANGNQIIFRGMNDEKQREKLKSITFQRGKLTDVWCEEATELTQADLEIIDDRLRGELPEGQFYQIRLTFNPVNKNHWIKKVFFDIPDPNVLTHHSTYLNNRFIDEAYRARMDRRKIVDPEGYQIYGLGEWGEIGGLILHNWEVRECSQNIADYMILQLGRTLVLIMPMLSCRSAGKMETSISCVSCMDLKKIPLNGSQKQMQRAFPKSGRCGVTQRNRIESKCGKMQDSGQRE